MSQLTDEQVLKELDEAETTLAKAGWKIQEAIEILQEIDGMDSYVKALQRVDITIDGLIDDIRNESDELASIG